MNQNRPTVNVLGTTLALALLLVPRAGAETITVGPIANGCNQPTLFFALFRAAETPESDNVIITTDQFYTGTTALVLDSEAAVTIRGGISCTNHAPRIRRITTTSGDLFEFEDTNVTIRDLDLVGDTGGRLITARGSSVIVLESSDLVDGVAEDGGNAHLSEGASLFVGPDSRIRGGNASRDGGGVYCQGTGTVVLNPNSDVSSNHATRNGGGIYADGCAVNVRSGGVQPNRGVWGNRAEQHGGGIYARDGATVNATGTSSRAASIRGNTAEANGGGMFLVGNTTTADLDSSEVVDNLALHRGGGFYLTSGAELLMKRDLAVCARGFRCSLIEGNSTTSGGFTTEEGGAIAVLGGAEANIHQTYVTDNSGADGGNVALVSGAGSQLILEGAALFANHPRGSHIEARNGGVARLAFVSAWGSSDPLFGTTFAVTEAGGRIDLFSSIVIEGNGRRPTGGGSDQVFGPLDTGDVHNADCVIAHELESLPPAGFLFTYSMATDPTVILNDPASGDPNLRWTSGAIDYCDTAVYAPIAADIDATSRGADARSVPDLFGPFDLGADEWTGEIFIDGFESGDVAAWSETAP